MKKVQGVSFGVRFYRRGVARTVIKDVAQDTPQPVEQETQTKMTDIPEQISSVSVASAPSKKPESALKEKALWMAAKEGDCYAIRLLVMDGADLDARDPQGRTAINIATQYNQKQALKTLLAAKEMRRLASVGDLPKSAFFEKFKNSKTGNDGR